MRKGLRENGKNLLNRALRDFIRVKGLERVNIEKSCSKRGCFELSLLSACYRACALIPALLIYYLFVANSVPARNGESK